MIVEYDREKVANILIFFATQIKRLGITKLCKLLYELDFRHFRATGKSVTGLVYKAWERGPVPTKLWGEIKHDPEKFRSFIRIIQEDKRSKFISLKKFDDSHFTDREIQLMKDVAFIYKEVDVKTAILATHEFLQPWDKTIHTKGKNAPIDYELAFDDSPDTIPREIYEEMEENNAFMKRALSE